MDRKPGTVGPANLVFIAMSVVMANRNGPSSELRDWDNDILTAIGGRANSLPALAVSVSQLTTRSLNIRPTRLNLRHGLLNLFGRRVCLAVSRPAL